MPDYVSLCEGGGRAGGRHGEPDPHGVNKPRKAGKDVHAPLEQQLTLLFQQGRTEEVGMHFRNKNIHEPLSSQHSCGVVATANRCEPGCARCAGPSGNARKKGRSDRMNGTSDSCGGSWFVRVSGPSTSLTSSSPSLYSTSPHLPFPKPGAVERESLSPFASISGSPPR